MSTVNDGIDKDVRNKIIAVISVLIPDASIYLFGSRAKGTYSEWSDIDIALDAGHTISSFDTGEIMSMFEASNILYKIQIVDINSVNDAMRKSIMKDRVLWKKYEEF